MTVNVINYVVTEVPLNSFCAKDTQSFQQQLLCISTVLRHLIKVQNVTNNY